MEVKIRPAVPGDYEALARLNRESMGYDYLPEKTKEQLEKLLSDGRTAFS